MINLCVSVLNLISSSLLSTLSSTWMWVYQIWNLLIWIINLQAPRRSSCVSKARWWKKNSWSLVRRNASFIWQTGSEYLLCADHIEEQNRWASLLWSWDDKVQLVTIAQCCSLRVNGRVVTHPAQRVLQKHNLRKYLSSYTCWGFCPVCSLKWILHPWRRTAGKKLVCKSKTKPYAQEQDWRCPTDTILGGSKPNYLAIEVWWWTKRRSGLGPGLKGLGPRGMVFQDAAVFQIFLQWFLVMWCKLCLFSLTYTLQYL